MTLHLTRLCNHYVLQLGDRLLSSSGNPRDPIANKNLFYVCRDAIVAIGYTGIAYGLAPQRPTLPTDQWIAEKLWGGDFPDLGERPGFLRVRRIDNFRDIGLSVRSLCESLDEAFENLPAANRKLPFELGIGGYKQDRRKQMIPIWLRIGRKHAGSRFEVTEKLERYSHLECKKIVYYLPRGYLPSGDSDKILEGLSSEHIDTSEKVLVETVREVSKYNSNIVGPHCVSILIFPDLRVRVRFLPLVPHRARFASQSRKFEDAFPVAFSPWLIGPGGYSAPSLFSGTWQWQSGGPVNVVVEGPEPHGNRFSLSSQRRFRP